MLSQQRRHFNSLFEADADPWGYRTRFTERRRHALVLAVLDRPTYPRAFEPACANGVFTSLLAGRCGTLLASDASPAAVALSKASTAGQRNVTVKRQELPDEWPAGSFELIVLIDFLYYLPAPEVGRLTSLASGSLTADGTLLVAHWRGTADDFVTPTAEVHRIVRARLGRAPDSRLDDRHHLVDMWVRQ